MSMEVRSNDENNAVDENPVENVLPEKVEESKAAIDEGDYNHLSIRDQRLIANLKSQMPGVANLFKIHRQIGEGTFSTVFLCTLRFQLDWPENKRKQYALKHLIPTTHPKRVAQELYCLKRLGGTSNVIGVELCLRHGDAIALVMPYVQHDRFQDYFNRMTAYELQQYMRNLLIALRHVHRYAIIHRDVKPSNFLHSKKTGKYLLVDFGLAQNLKSDDNTTIDRTDSTKPTNEHEPVGIRGVKGTNNDCDTSKMTNEQPATNDTDTAMITEQSSSSANTNNRPKRKASELSETENMNSAAKRINTKDERLTCDELLPLNSPSPTKPYIPSTAKSPLKQLNEISSLKDRSLTVDASITQNVKSAMLESSTHAKNAEGKQRNEGDGGATKSDMVTEIANKVAIGTAASANATTPAPDVTPDESFNVPHNVSSNKERNVTLNISPNAVPQTPNVSPSVSPNVTLNIAPYLTPNVSPTVTPNVSPNAAPSLPAPPAAVPIKYVLNKNTRCIPKCVCFARPTVCNICIVKREINAARAGTPGYRPSEVLMKYPIQTTAVDMWAAGVILISILSGCYPFFKGKDDYKALAEIITVFGDKVVSQCALKLGRKLSLSQTKNPLHLRKLCIRLRNGAPSSSKCNPSPDCKVEGSDKPQRCDNCEQVFTECLCFGTDWNSDFSKDKFPDSAYDLLEKLLAIHPNDRISAAEALEHSFFKEQLA